MHVGALIGLTPLGDETSDAGLELASGVSCMICSISSAAPSSWRWVSRSTAGGACWSASTKWWTYCYYRTDHVGSRRKTILSADGGESWPLLRTDDLR